MLARSTNTEENGSSDNAKTRVKKDVVFCNQIRSAALSIMSNIAEGFESSTDKESRNFLNYARRSCGEVRSDLYAGLDDGYITQQEFQMIYGQSCKTGKLISGFIFYLRESVKNRRYDNSTIRR